MELFIQQEQSTPCIQGRFNHNLTCKDMELFIQQRQIMKSNPIKCYLNHVAVGGSRGGMMGGERKLGKQGFGNLVCIGGELVTDLRQGQKWDRLFFYRSLFLKWNLRVKVEIVYSICYLYLYSQIYDIFNTSRFLWTF